MNLLLTTIQSALSEKDYLILVEVMPKVVVSAIVGGIIGLSRERKGKPAGLKTHILLCVGACVFTAVSLIMKTNGLAPDGSRIIAQIVSGIGFLGAGTIFRDENKVFGLTSAAFIWVVAALGVLVGVGGYVSGIILALGCVSIMTIVHKLEIAFIQKGSSSEDKG
jgi:putative Mg2+ transporter-C (MgtC) family protein